MKDNEDVLNLKFRICDNVEYKIDDNGRVTIFEKQDHRIQSFFRKLKFRIPLYATLYRKNIKMVSYLKACHFLVGICKNYSIYGKNY